ncbi:MAG TPA: cupin domain-containing protein [Candidatus Bathyarchaeia archaeon]|nr:cupin domain-containing protein [Candidatus Bathyarchaeia archaeon]
MLTVEALKARLRLRPHPVEGGFFAETYRSGESLPATALAGRYAGARALATAIYYLLTPETFSALHRLASDEIFHFYLGDPVEMLQLWPDGSHRLVTIGTDLEAGEHPQVLVPRGVWQGARLRSGGRLALLGTTVAPGFDLADYESGRREPLARRWPAAAELIAALTR